MGQDVQSPILISSCPSSSVTDLPGESLLHEHHQDITKVDLLLTEPSQVIEAGPEEGEQQKLALLRKPQRGQVCFDLSWVLIAGSHVSAKRASRKHTHPGLDQV